jgi:zinc protease
VLDTGTGLSAVTAEQVRALFARLAAEKEPVTVVSRAR